MRTIRRGPGYGFTLFTLSGLLLSACGSELDEAPPEVENRQGAALACNHPDGCCDPAIYETCSIQNFTAANGARIVLKTFSCPGVAASTKPSATCPVEDQFYAIGGGAMVLGTFNASIKESVPLVGLNGSWSATSENIGGPASHSLQAFAIGMKLYTAGGRTVNLANDIHRYVNTRYTGDDKVTSTTAVSADELLIGGGWFAGARTFAVDAYAIGMLGGKWRLNAEAFGGGGLIFGVAIGLSRCLPAASPLVCFGHRDILEATSADGTSIQGAVAYNTHPSSMVVGVGAVSSSWDRPIWALFPAGAGPSGGSDQYGAGAAFNIGTTGDPGNVMSQIMTIGL